MSEPDLTFNLLVCRTCGHSDTKIGPSCEKCDGPCDVVPYVPAQQLEQEREHSKSLRAEMQRQEDALEQERARAERLTRAIEKHRDRSHALLQNDVHDYAFEDDRELWSALHPEGEKP